MKRHLFLLTSTCMGLLGSACGKGSSLPARIELTVYAATSTRDALMALEEVYERERGVELVFNFGSSGDLANQIVAAAQADVFLSADEQEMDKLEQAGLLEAGTRRSLLSNQLVVVEPTAGTSVFELPFSASQLGGPKLKRLSLANVESVPAGRYAKAWLSEAGVFAAVRERVLPGVDVRAALAAVEAGAAEAGIVYRTDAACSNRVRLVYALPREEGPAISYPLAAIAGGAQESASRAWIDFLCSARAAAVFESFGFVCLPETAELPE